MRESASPRFQPVCLFVCLFFYLLDGCTPPEVSILNLSDDVPSAAAILRSKDFIVEANTGSPHCNTKTPQFQWLLFKLQWDDSLGSLEEGIGTELQSTANGFEWHLQKRHLVYGVYRVVVKVTMAGDPEGLTTDEGYFNITKSPLVAEIAGGSKITRGIGTAVGLNGALSRDPDVEPGNYSLMQFTWLCKNQQESFPNVSLATLPVVTESSGPGNGGCFGTGIGRLDSSDITLTLETSKMTAGELYDVKLVVTKDDREADFTQEIEIVNGDPPEVTIRYVRILGKPP